MLSRCLLAGVVAGGALGLGSCGGTRPSVSDLTPQGGAAGAATLPGAGTNSNAGRNSGASGGRDATNTGGENHGGSDVQSPGSGGTGADSGVGGNDPSSAGAGGQEANPPEPAGGSAGAESGSASLACTFDMNGIALTVEGPCTPGGSEAVSIEVGTAPANLENSVVPAGPVVTLGSVASRRVTLRLPRPADAPQAEVIAVRIGADGAITPLASDVDGMGSIIDVRGDGSYALVRVAPAALPNCSAEVLAGSHSASANSELAALANVSFIAGSLSLLGGVTDLSALSCLRSIGGDLVVADTTALTNTAGLSNLVRIDGKLAVSSNTALASFALPELMLLGQELKVELNDALGELTLSRLPELLSTTRAVDIVQNGAAATNGTRLNFDALQVVRGLFTLEQNPGIEDLDGFAALSRFEGGVYIEDNAGLEALRLPALEQAARWFYVSGNSSLSVVEAPKLSALGRSDGSDTLKISSNAALQRVHLPALRLLYDDLVISSNGSTAAADTVLDLGALESVGGALDMNGNARLRNLEGFPALRSITGYLTLQGNDTLTRASLELDALGGFDIRTNPALTSIELLGITTTAYVRVQNNAALTKLDLSDLEEITFMALLEENGANVTSGSTVFDLSSVKTIAGNLRIYANPALENLDGFSALETVDGFLAINVNAGLTDTSGLASLEYIGAYLIFNDNDALTSLDLSSLTYLGTDLYVTNNALLPTCVATALRDAIPPREDRERGANITNNLADTCPEDPAPPEL